MAQLVDTLALEHVLTPGKSGRGHSDLECRINQLEEELKLLKINQEAQRNALVFTRGTRSGNKLYFTNGLEMNYFVGNTICTAAGGQLASPQNLEENQAILDIAVQQKRIPYLGINDLAVKGSYRYPDNNAINYSNWEANEPNNENGIERCVEMYENGKWNDKNCNEKRLIICEFF
ncbi:pulmonary surfactant-associated protein D-like [Pelodytes ibericus]